jgi:hypothetical protein
MSRETAGLSRGNICQWLETEIKIVEFNVSAIYD